MLKPKDHGLDNYLRRIEDGDIVAWAFVGMVRDGRTVTTAETADVPDDTSTLLLKGLRFGCIHLAGRLQASISGDVHDQDLDGPDCDGGVP